VLLKRGQTKESIAELRHASELLPRDSTILEHLADAQAISGDTREASTTYERAIEALSASIQETGAQESGAQENSLDRLRLEQKKDALSEVLRP
jgi:predicted Zn-dependent protease